MLDSKLAEKLLRLGLCPGAHQGEWESAAIKFFASLRKEGVQAEEFLRLTNGSQRSSGQHQSGPRPSDHYSSEITMPFGKHKGNPISYIARNDPTYLRWCLREIQNLRPWLRAEMETELERYGY
jgi:hypothetical protein